MFEEAVEKGQTLPEGLESLMKATPFPPTSTSGAREEQVPAVPAVPAVSAATDDASASSVDVPRKKVTVRGIYLLLLNSSGLVESIMFVHVDKVAPDITTLDQ